MPRSNNRKTQRQEIADYWSERVDESELSVDWAEATKLCWCCGYERKLERCHIIPAQEPFNGPDEPSNYVLLCRTCHDKAPVCGDPNEMWLWLKTNKQTFYKFSRIIEGMEFAQKYYGVNTEVLDALSIDRSRFVKIVTSMFPEIGTHSGGITSGTVAYIVRRAYEEIILRAKRANTEATTQAA